MALGLSPIVALRADVLEGLTLGGALCGRARAREHGTAVCALGASWINKGEYGCERGRYDAQANRGGTARKEL